MTRTSLALSVLLGSLSTAALADHGGPGPMRIGLDPMFDFAAVDTNGDGKITPEELTAFRAARIAALDADKDGEISVSELQAQIEARMKARAADMAARMIVSRDSDGDGLLSAAELAEAPDMSMADRLFDRADADGDGAVTEMELQAMRDRFAARMKGHGENGQHPGKMGWWFGPGYGN